MCKTPVGTIVYIKKSSKSHYAYGENAFLITGHVKKRSGIIKAALNSGLVISFGELTDIPCSAMGCGNCKWHPKSNNQDNK